MTRNEQKERESLLDIFSTRFSQLVEESGKLQNEIAKDLKGNKSNIYYWSNGYVLPSMQRLVRISLYFGVSVDYLLGIDDVRNRKEG